MKVLILGYGYPTEKYPMNGLFSFDQAKILNSTYDVIYGFLDMRSLRRIRKFGFETLNLGGLKIIGLNIPIGIIPKRLFIFLQNRFMNILLKKISRSEMNIKIIHSHFYDISHSALKNKSIIAAKYILTEHGDSFNNDKINNNLRRIAGYAYSNSDINLAVSYPLSKSLFKHFGINFEVIENVFDFELFKYDEKVEKYRDFTFISVGSLIKRKGMDRLIEQFSNAFESKSNKKLLIIGEGPERRNLESLIAQYDLSDSVKILGSKTRQEISLIIKKCHSFILLSKQESFGVVYIEALACGLPVIATICGGPEDFINKTNGYLVDQSKIYEVPKILISLFKNYNYFNQKSISNYALTKFGPKTFLSKIEKIYFS